MADPSGAKCLVSCEGSIAGALALTVLPAKIKKLTKRGKTIELAACIFGFSRFVVQKRSLLKFAGIVSQISLPIHLIALQEAGVSVNTVCS